MFVCGLVVYVVAVVGWLMMLCCVFVCVFVECVLVGYVCCCCCWLVDEVACVYVCVC